MGETPDYYEYYLLGRVTPVRVAFDRAGLVMGAEVPDPNGGFLHDATYLSRLRDSDQVEKIDRADFEASAYAYRRTRNGQAPGSGS